MDSPFSRPFTLDRVVRLVIAIVVVAAMLWLVNELRGVLLPFLVACVIAYILEPIVQLHRRRLHIRGRVVPVLLTLVEVIVAVVAAGWFIIPSAIDEMHQFGEAVRQYASVAQGAHQGSVLPGSLHQFLKRNIDLNGLSELLTRQEWMSLIEQVISTTWNILTGSIALIIGVFNWFIVVLYVVFVMIDYNRIKSGIFYLVPPRYRHITRRLAGDVVLNMNRYFRGQALVASLVGVLFAIGFWLIGLPMAVVVGLFIGVLNLVPYLQLVSIVPVTFLCIVYSVGGNGDFWVIFAQCIAVYAIVQVIQDFFLTPRIMGKTMGMNPAVILLSLSVWGTLLGMIGLIIALPLTTLLFAYYKEYVLSDTITPQ